MFNFYIFFQGYSKNDYTFYMWKDVLTPQKNITGQLVYNPFKSDNVFDTFLHRLCFSDRVNSIIFTPFKWVWDRQVCLPNNLSKEDNNIAIFYNNIRLSPKMIQTLKSIYHFKIVLYLPDTLEKTICISSMNDLQKYKNHFFVDTIYSFDPKDCQKYGLNFFDVYSKSANTKIKTSKYDLFYVGSYRSKERIIVLNYLANLPIKSKLILNGVPENCKININSKIEINHFLNYEETLKYVNESKVLLEILNDGQSGNTLRFKEAVCFNKYFLTTNKMINLNKYYNEKFIYILSKDSKNLLQFFAKNAKPNYYYDNSFSPLVLENMIIKELYK
jgi:hypothetical protein